MLATSLARHHNKENLTKKTVTLLNNTKENDEVKILNQTLHIAKSSKKDEFYTQLSDIESELKHYEEHFKNKVVFVIVTTRGIVIFSNIFH